MAEEVRVRIITETTGTDGVRDANNAVRQLGKDSISAGQAIKRAFDGLAGYFAVNEILKVGRAILSTGSQMEQAKISFTTFTGSAEKATKMLSDLQDFANATPFDNEQVIGAGRALTAFGIENQKLIPTLKAVGDISAATGKDFNELAVIYGKARTQGTLYAEDINQLTEAGIPIIDEFAKILGKPPGEIKKLASQGQIGFGMLERAFGNMTNEGGRFYNLMQAQSQTTAGKWSNFVGLVQMGAIQIFNALQPYINQLIDLSTQYLPVVIALAKGFWHELRDAARWVKQNQLLLVTLGSALAAYITYTQIATLWAGRQAIATNILTAAQAALNFVMSINPIGLVIAAIAALVGALVYLFNTNEKVRGTLLALWNVTKAVFKGIYDAAKLYLLSTAKLIKGIFTFDADAIKEAVVGFASGAKDIAINTVNGTVQGVQNGFSQAAKDLKEGTQDAKAGGTAARTFMGLTTTDTTTTTNTDTKTKPGAKGSAVGSVTGSRPTSVHLHINKLVGVETLKSDLSSLKRGEVPQMSDSLLSTLIRMLTDAEQYAL